MTVQLSFLNSFVVFFETLNLKTICWWSINLPINNHWFANHDSPLIVDTIHCNCIRCNTMRQSIFAVSYDCPRGTFNSAAEGRADCVDCFCFGHGTSFAACGSSSMMMTQVRGQLLYAHVLFHLYQWRVLHPLLVFLSDRIFVFADIIAKICFIAEANWNTQRIQWFSYFSLFQCIHNVFGYSRLLSRISLLICS